MNLLGLFGNEELGNRSTKKNEELDHMKKKEDSRKSSLLSMMNNVFISMSEARVRYETLTSLSTMYYHIRVYHVYAVTWKKTSSHLQSKTYPCIGEWFTSKLLEGHIRVKVLTIHSTTQHNMTIPQLYKGMAKLPIYKDNFSKFGGAKALH